MRTISISWILIAAAGALSASLVAGAQDTPPASQTPTSAKQESKPAPQKPRKIWTDDDITSLRSPAEIYTAQKEAQAVEAARLAKQQAAAEKQAAAAKPAKPAGPSPALSNPKDLDAADKMIAWEDRDIEALQESIDSLRKQIDEAPAEDKERLQKLLDQNIQMLEETRKERQALVDKKKEFEKPAPAANSATPAPPPPSQ
jgi:chromosome segregation ATPase